MHFNLTDKESSVTLISKIYGQDGQGIGTLQNLKNYLSDIRNLSVANSVLVKLSGNSIIARVQVGSGLKHIVGLPKEKATQTSWTGIFLGLNMTHKLYRKLEDISNMIVKWTQLT